MVEHLLRSADLLDITVFHNDDAVAQRHGLGLVMGNIHKRGVDVLAQLDQLSTHLIAQLCVEVAQRLVHEEDLRMANNCAADGDTLALTAGERLGLSLQILGDTENLRRFLHLLVDLSLGNLAQLESERHVFIHGHMRVERVVLEDHRDVAILGGNVVDETVADVKLTLGNLFQTGDHAQSCRFAAAGRPDENHKLFVRDVKRKLLHRHYVFVVDLLDVLERYTCHCVLGFIRRSIRSPPDSQSPDDVTIALRQVSTLPHRKPCGWYPSFYTASRRIRSGVTAARLDTIEKCFLYYRRIRMTAQYLRKLNPAFPCCPATPTWPLFACRAHDSRHRCSKRYILPRRVDLY
ncbi:hypothetical protein SDC9_131761 [bioreactor metagenome]|uniref:Uncharacterized protein n=1 Tax=bioreactor metagenome TaxID=1076179 RepID=A0A645D6J9_9ZZZZ